MSRWSVLLVAGLLLQVYAQVGKQQQYEESDGTLHDEDAYEDEADGGFMDAGRIGQYVQEMRLRIKRHVDTDSLLRARRWGNVVNGLLLGVTGPVALAVSTFGLKLSSVVLSLYVTLCAQLDSTPQPVSKHRPGFRFET